MRSLPLVLLLGGATLALTAKEVHDREGSTIFGPVKTVTEQMRFDARSPDADFGGSDFTQTYDREGRLLHSTAAYYEGGEDIRYEYAGNCVKRRYEERGYVEVPKVIEVYFPDASCKDSQIAIYTDGKMTGRTVVTRSGNTTKQVTYRQDNSISKTVTTTCTADRSECQILTTGKDENSRETRRYWPGGTLKYLFSHQDSEDGTWYENESEYNEKGWQVKNRWTYFTFRGDNGNDLPEGKAVTTHYTYRYTATDKYGNWTARQDYRIVQSFGKASEVLDGKATRKFSYY